jgi:hypothetical protein
MTATAATHARAHHPWWIERRKENPLHPMTTPMTVMTEMPVGECLRAGRAIRLIIHDQKYPITIIFGYLRLRCREGSLSAGAAARNSGSGDSEDAPG